MNPADTDPFEGQRRLSARIHAALGASLVAYGLLLALIRARTSLPTPAHPGRVSPFAIFIVLGIVQYVVISTMARRRLRTGTLPPPARARAYFLLLAVAAEVLGLYGLLIGVMGSPLPQTLLFFGLAFAALILTAPTREAWANAVRAAQDPGP